jgi:hypothetical protein
MVVKPSATSLWTVSATSMGVPLLQSTSAHICMLADLLWLYSTMFPSRSKGLDLVKISDQLHLHCDASKLRIAISRPHLTLGNIDEGWWTGNKRKFNLLIYKSKQVSQHPLHKYSQEENKNIPKKKARIFLKKKRFTYRNPKSCPHPIREGSFQQRNNI